MRSKTLVVGGGGREAAMAWRLSEDDCVYAISPHRNPTLDAVTKRSGGTLDVGDITSGRAVSRCATAHGVDRAIVSADGPLAAGVVDTLLAAGIPTFGPTRDGARIEWDKLYASELVGSLRPGILPATWVAHDAKAVMASIADARARGVEVVIKPRGLTGGKGVKVMGPHLPDYESAKRYALSALPAVGQDGGVLIVEKLTGIEFTVMALTDGVNLVPTPCSYDYAYRREGDTGPGTGGMGAFTQADGLLPHVTQSDVGICRDVMQSVLDRMHADGRKFNGVLYGGFFKTPRGIRFVEFNARFGDPECMSAMLALSSSFSDIVTAVIAGNLTPDLVRFAPRATVVKYLVNPEYPDPPEAPRTFTWDTAKAGADGVKTFFAAAEHVAGGTYRTVGGSRVLALGAVAKDVASAASVVEASATPLVSSGLDWRRDIGTNAHIKGMTA